MINVMTAGLWEQEINVTQWWQGILKLHLRVLLDIKLAIFPVHLHIQLFLLCLICPPNTCKMASSWRILPKTWGGGVQPASQNPCPIYDQNLSFLLSYLLPDQKFDSLLMTIKGS